MHACMHAHVGVHRTDFTLDEEGFCELPNFAGHRIHLLQGEVYIAHITTVSLFCVNRAFFSIHDKHTSEDILLT